MVTTRTHTVKQNNIDPAFQNAKAEESVLSILYTQDGLSFLVRHVSTRQVYLTGFIPQAELSDEPIEEVLQAFPERPAHITLLVAFHNSTLLPTEFSAQSQQWTQKILGAEANYSSVSSKLGMEVLSCVSQKELRLTQVAGIQVQHLWLSQMEVLQPKQGEELWVHVMGTTMLILAAKAGKWTLTNSFPCGDEQEFIYHLGNVVEQLGYDRATMRLEISGYAAAAFKDFIAPYFGDVSLFKSKNWAQISSALQGWDPVEYAPLLRL